jgi:ubiquinone/menaquinone biosynthesis C-methylase UbiE
MFRSTDRAKCQQLFTQYYAGRRFHDAMYRDVIARHLRPGHRLLDAGCGRYMKFCKDFSGTASVVGIDLESVLETDNTRNPFGVCGDVSRLPFPNNTFDLVISRSVVEHLENPDLTFREMSRVLRPGGKVIIVTPNKYDYVSVVAALTPHWLHQALVSRIFQIPPEDVFPTMYRANTISSLRKALTTAGLSETAFDTINHYPAYLMFSPVLFRLGVLYERITSLPVFRSLRGSLLCVFEKPAVSEDVETADSAVVAGPPLKAGRVP